MSKASRNDTKQACMKKQAFMNKTVLSSAISILVSTGMTLGAPALAQDEQTPEASQEDRIIVTGSRIPRAEFESLQPASVIDRSALDLRAVTNVADAINEQVGFTVPGNSPIGLQGGATLGQNFVDFLGLGPQRTLTLVNGQRFPAGASADGFGGLSVDLNAIPEALIDRVETIAIGGAPIYGSDAIAGTVNIILRDDFEGLELIGQYGFSPEFGDGDRYRVGATFGKNFDDGRGNVVLSGEYSSAEGLRDFDRPATAVGQGFEAPADPDSPFNQVLVPDPTVAVDNVRPFPLFFGDQFFFNIFGNGIPVDPSDPDSPISQFDENGNLLPFVPGGGTGSVIFQSGGDGLDLTDFSSLYADLKRYNANIFVTYDVTNSVRFKAEGWFARSESIEIINQPFFNSPAFGGLPANGWGNVGEGPIPVLIDNPFLSDATRTTIAAALDMAQDFDMDGSADPTIDTDGDGTPDAVGFWRGGPLTGVVGDNPDSATRDTYRAVFGFDGDVSFGGRDFVWDLNYSYGRTVSNVSGLTIIQSNFDKAVQVLNDGGNPVCADPSGGCVPLNVIGQPTQEAVDYVSEFVTDKSVVQQHVVSGNIGGDIFDLPAGPVGTSVGFAYRVEKSSYNPNDLAENGFTRNTLVPIDGRFNSTEFYGEALIPLLGGELDTPLVDRLEIEGAVRFVDNSVAGSDLTWTAGGRYAPIPDIEFRGNVTESIRAPSITELFTPESRFFAFANDPCDARFIDQGNVPAVRAANCAADGIMQPFTSFIANASQPATLSGNPDLSNEIAKSWTVGVIMRPRFLEGFTIAVDWLDIDVHDAIETATAVDILRACYDSSNFPDEPSCDLFDRDAGGQVINMRTGFVNVGLVEFSGLTTVASYDLPLGEWGDLNIRVNHLYTDRHIETPGSGNSVRLDGQIGESKHRITANTTWSYGKFRWFNQFRWINGAVFDNTDDANTRNIRGVGDWLVVDSGIAYDLNEQIELQLNADNLLNASPPSPGILDQNFAMQNTYFPGILERYLTFTVRGHF